VDRPQETGTHSNWIAIYESVAFRLKFSYDHGDIQVEGSPLLSEMSSRNRNIVNNWEPVYQVIAFFRREEPIGPEHQHALAEAMTVEHKNLERFFSSNDDGYKLRESYLTWMEGEFLRRARLGAQARDKRESKPKRRWWQIWR
jgi:hypothetical protein